MGLSRGQVVAAGVAAAVVAAAIGVGVAVTNSGGGSGAKGISRSPGVSTAGPVAGPGGGAPSSNAAGAPIAPVDNTAVIYNTFGGLPGDVAMVEVVKERLIKEGYNVTVFQDRAEGLEGVGDNSLENFITMAKASVIVIDTHGLAAAGDSSKKVCNAAGKGLVRLSPTPEPDLCDGTPASETPPTTPSYIPLASNEPGLLVAWYNDIETLADALRKYINVDHYDPSWFELAAGERSNGANGHGLVLSAAGIDHFFTGSHLAVVDALACYSLGVASSFHAQSYFGYSDRACDQSGVADTETLFDRLTGADGVPERTTVEAMAKGGFQDPDLHLADGARPVVLSPAVTSTTPAEGTPITKGSTTAGEVRFDARMETSDPSRVVTVSGCNATIDKAEWDSEGTKLSFNLKVPPDAPDGIITLTVGKDTARADPGTFPNHRLDGNQDPFGQSGLEPNRDDYTWSVPCSIGIYPLRISYSGTFTDAYSLPAVRSSTLRPFYSNTSYKFSESRLITVRLIDGAMTTTNSDPTVTVSGSSTTVNLSDLIPEVNCTWRAAPGAGSDIFVNGLLPATPQTIRLQAPAPAIVGSGVCSDSSPAPYSFWHPDLNERYDPGGRLQALNFDKVDQLDLAGLWKKPFTQKFTVDYTQHDRLGGIDRVTANATLSISLTGTGTSGAPPFDPSGPALDNLQKTSTQLGAGGDQAVPVEDEHWPDPGTLLDEVCIVPDPTNPTGPCPSANDLASGSFAVAPSPAANSSGNLVLHLTSAGTAAIADGNPIVVLLRVTYQPQQGPPITATRVLTLAPQSKKSAQPPPSTPPTPAITSVTFGGSEQDPTLAIHGQGFGTAPPPNPANSPSNQPLCPVTINGNAGLDYGTNLYIEDVGANPFAAGRYRPERNELDCLGLIVTNFNTTEVDLRIGDFYKQAYPKYRLAPGDVINITINGATISVHANYGATVTS